MADRKAGSRVLVLDDDSQMTRILRAAGGFDVLCASSVLDARDIALSEPGLQLIIISEQPASRSTPFDAIARLIRAGVPQGFMCLTSADLPNRLAAIRMIASN